VLLIKGSLALLLKLLKFLPLKVLKIFQHRRDRLMMTKNKQTRNKAIVRQTCSQNDLLIPMNAWVQESTKPELRLKSYKGLKL
jgi:hypothetical protein